MISVTNAYNDQSYMQNSLCSINVNVAANPRQIQMGVDLDNATLRLIRISLLFSFLPFFRTASNWITSETVLGDQLSSTKKSFFWQIKSLCQVISRLRTNQCLSCHFVCLWFIVVFAFFTSPFHLFSLSVRSL
jgi:hypothetical protein